MEEHGSVNLITKNVINLTIIPKEVVLDCGNSKIFFKQEKITIDDVLQTYVSLKNFLNTFNGVNI